MNSLIYQIGIKFLILYMNLLSFFGNKKIKSANIGRKNWKNSLSKINRRKNIIWIHAASHGEAIMTIPIINGLSFSSHPSQILSDVFTIEEIKKKPISKLQICWIGDGNNNVINSLIEASIKFSFKLNIGCPKKYEPNKKLLIWVKKNKGKLRIFNEATKAAKESDVIFTDKVISMNDKVNKAKKLKDFKNFKVNFDLMSCAKKDAIFLHCLPRGMEVSNDVFLSKHSKVWQQALNRVYVQKSILLYCFDKLR